MVRQDPCQTTEFQRTKHTIQLCNPTLQCRVNFNTTTQTTCGVYTIAPTYQLAAIFYSTLTLIAHRVVASPIVFLDPESSCWDLVYISLAELSVVKVQQPPSGIFPSCLSRTVSNTAPSKSSTAPYIQHILLTLRA